MGNASGVQSPPFWSTLANFSTTLSATRLDRAHLREVVPQVASETLVGAAGLFVRSPDGPWLDLVGVHHPDEDGANTIRMIFAANPHPIDGGVLGPVVQQNEPMLIPDVPRELLREFYADHYDQYIDRWGVTSIAAVPVRAHGDVFGALVVARFTGADPLTETDTEFLQALADRAGLELANARLMSDMRDALAHMSAIVESAVDAIITIGSDGTVLSANQATTRMFGWEVQELVGQPMSTLMPEPFASEYPRNLSSYLTTGEPKVTGAGRSAQGLTKTGRRFPIELSVSEVRVDGQRMFTGIVRDVTERESARRELERLASVDHLTGIANRHALVRLLDAAVSGARTTVGVVFIDLDGFKAVNDTHGHSVGDEVLIEAARRLSSCVRDDDVVARWGGDEFVVACLNRTPQQITAVAERVLEAFSHPLTYNGVDFAVGVSVGTASYPQNASSAFDAITKADDAMYHGRQQGQHFQVWRPGTPSHAARDDKQREEITLALRNGEFAVWYQPVIMEGLQVGAEALIRWQRSPTQFVPPDEFIPFAERTRLIHAIGEFVLTEACGYAAAHPELGMMAVNFSRAQLVLPGLYDQVTGVLHRTGLPADRLCLEVTEGAVAEVPDYAFGDLARLREAGVHIAVDDFGTGMSCLAALRDFPVDILKIDRMFTWQLPNDDRITKTIIALAHELGFTVIAEGVETDAQRETLAALGCDLMQGFLFAAPAPAP